MADKGRNCSLWLKFFRDAGITGGFDTKYALVFDENRIKMNMLMDLNKECLRDMGIKAMGDIIAILKHAKVVHDESMEQAFESSKPTQSEPSKTTSDGRNQIASTSSSSAAPLIPASVPVIPKSANANTSAKITTTTRTIVNDVSSEVPKVKPREISTPTVVRKVIPSPSSSGPGTLKKRLIVLTPDEDSSPKRLREEVPVQKKIRVLPEHEGKYKISMPQRTIRGVGKILVNRLGPSTSESASTFATLNKEKRTVGIFNRLGPGESKVSSTRTSTEHLGSSKTRESTVKPSSINDVSSADGPGSKASVFARLGGRSFANSEVATAPAPSPSRLTLLSRTFTTDDKHEATNRGKISLPNKTRSPALATAERRRESIKVYRNPDCRELSPPTTFTRKIENSSRMRSEISALNGRLNDISKSREEFINSSRVSLVAAKKISSISRATAVSNSSGAVSEQLEARKGSGTIIKLNSPHDSKRVVTRKIQPPLKAVSSFDDLPELEDLEEDPMDRYFD